MWSEGVKKIWHDPVWSKVIAYGIVGIVGLAGAYIYGSWPSIKVMVTACHGSHEDFVKSIDRNFLDTFVGAAVLLLSWLSVLILIRKLRSSDPTIFEEDFSHELENWEFAGGWFLENRPDGKALVVTNSEVGGISKWCLSWKDYVFEFKTKLLSTNCGWLIRAVALDNYVRTLRDHQIKSDS